MKSREWQVVRDDLFNGAVAIVDGILSDELDGIPPENVVIVGLQRLDALRRQMELAVTIGVN